MYRNYTEIIQRAREMGPQTVSVAAAQDLEVLEAIKSASDKGIARAILVGDERLLRPLMEQAGLPQDTPLIHEPDVNKAALMAVSLVKAGEAQILMKGLVNSSDFLRAVLNQEVGLKAGRLLSHLAVFEVPGQDKLVFLSDGGINISPNLSEKKEILINALLAMHSMGIKKPYVAALTANEVVNSKMPSTLDARALADMSEEGDLPAAVVEGPIALDVAVSSESARRKGLQSRVTGQVDLLLTPDIETGNILGKALIYYGGAKMSGLVLGAAKPIVMTSRAETAEGKLNSIALASLACSKSQTEGEG